MSSRRLLLLRHRRLAALNTRLTSLAYSTTSSAAPTTASIAMSGGLRLLDAAPAVRPRTPAPPHSPAPGLAPPWHRRRRRVRSRRRANATPFKHRSIRRWRRRRRHSRSRCRRRPERAHRVLAPPCLSPPRVPQLGGRMARGNGGLSSSSSS